MSVYLLGISYLILSMFAVWLILVSLLAIIRPKLALAGLAEMGSSKWLHLSGLTLRSLVGIGFLIGAKWVKFPQTFQVIGLFLLTSSILIMILPHRSHHRFAKFWAARIRPEWLKFIMPLGVLAGGLLLWALY